MKKNKNQNTNQQTIFWRASLILLCLLHWVPDITEARRQRGGGSGRPGLPIKEDETNGLHRHEERRRKASECRFGDQTFELEQTWHPDLGPPFGVMYCVHCECVPIHKKRRIVGRVQCKNIKTQCPKVTCLDPILLPGRCCKVCPGHEDQNPDLSIEVDLKREEEEKNGRHYAALLSKKSSLLSSTAATSAATGRLYFRKKTLTYSFLTSPQFGKAKLLTFLDVDGNIIEEFPLQPSHFQNETGKICGSWQRLPRRYRKQLRRDEIYAQLTSENEDNISGKVAKHYGLRSELFSALIADPNGSQPGAATAIVSLDSQTGSVHANLLMSGIFETDGEKNVPLEVKFSCEHEGETRDIVEHLSIAKVDDALTTVDFTTVIGDAELSALGEGRLSITVHAKNAPYNQISGFVAPRFSCDIFDSILSTHGEGTEAAGDDDDMDEDDNEAIEVIEAAHDGSAGNSDARGFAWMQMDRSGLIKYHLKWNDLSSDLVSIQIDNGRKSQRLLRIVHEMNLNPDVEAGEGWANGTFRMDAKDIDAFYHANLYINVATTTNVRALRGRIVQNLLGLAQEFSRSPILLHGNPPNRTAISGLAWINVDSTCRLHYQVRLNAGKKATEAKILLQDHPMQNLKALNLVPGRQLDLQDFVGLEASGHQDSIHKLTMARMGSGDASISVQSQNEPNFVVEGRISDIKIPQECRPRFSRNDLEMMPGFLNDLGEEVPEADRAYAMKCLYEGTIYEDGSQWKATHEACKMCSCQRGKVVCDDILCADVTCAKPFLPEGECCPLCSNVTLSSENLDLDHSSGCYLEGDQVLHPSGSRWHPYIPPFGFSRCATCTCQAATLKVECQSQKCPRLDCPAEQQVRPDALACCQICMPTTTPDPTQIAAEQKVLAPQTMPEERTNQNVLEAGGCSWRDDVVENGYTWNPRVLPYGEVQCVSCACKDGHVKCQRLQCRPLSCKYKIYDEDNCCPRCAVNRAETKKAKKLLRILKLKQVRRLRRQRQNTRLSSPSGE